MQSWPGVLTPSECFAALGAGADGLKVFPAFQMGTEGLKAVRAVLPKETEVFMVGGVGPENFASTRSRRRAQRLRARLLALTRRAGLRSGWRRPRAQASRPGTPARGLVTV